MERLGKYIIKRPLGEGGMGIVYEGFDPVIGRHVAIKLIHQRMMSAGMKERFYREAQAAGRLAHPNVTTLYDVGEQDGDPFLVLELLDGTDLRHRMRDEPPLSLEQKLDIAEQICRGLHYAHERDVIHRDIKPDNIRLLPDGRVKIMDFGLARSVSDTLTHSGMGTPQYMSPEQIKDEEVDRRTDIFSFGVLFYEMLAGTNPFRGARISSVIYKILHEEPEPPQVEEELLSEGLQAIVVRCIEKDPERRFQHFGDVLTALKTARRTVVPVPVPERTAAPRAAARSARSAPAAPEPSRSYRIPVLVLALLTLAVASYFLLGGDEASEPVASLAEASTSTTESAPPLIDSNADHSGEAETALGSLVQGDASTNAVAEPADEARVESTPQPPGAPPEAETRPQEDDVQEELADDEQAEREAARRAATQRLRQRAEEANASMAEARRRARARREGTAAPALFSRADAVRSEGEQAFREESYSAASARFEEARALYDAIPRAAEEVAPEPAPDPSAADAARAAMREAKRSVADAMNDTAPFREGEESEQRAEQAYSTEAFDAAEEHFQEAENRYAAAAALPTPREEVTTALRDLTRRLERSLENEDTEALVSVHGFYAPNTWKGFFDVVTGVEASTSFEIGTVSATSASATVSLELDYRNNKNEKLENRLTYAWSLTRDAQRGWALARVQTR